MLVEKVRELQELKVMADELAAIEDTIKAEMIAAGKDERPTPATVLTARLLSPRIVPFMTNIASRLKAAILALIKRKFKIMLDELMNLTHHINASRVFMETINNRLDYITNLFTDAETSLQQAENACRELNETIEGQ